MHGLQTSYTIRTFNSLHFSGFLNKWLIFYELFCEGPSALRKYALIGGERVKETEGDIRSYFSSSAFSPHKIRSKYNLTPWRQQNIALILQWKGEVDRVLIFFKHWPIVFSYPARACASRGLCDWGWCPFICTYVYVYVTKKKFE